MSLWQHLGLAFALHVPAFLLLPSSRPSMMRSSIPSLKPFQFPAVCSIGMSLFGWKTPYRSPGKEDTAHAKQEYDSPVRDKNFEAWQKRLYGKPPTLSLPCFICLPYHPSKLIIHSLQH